MQSGKSTTSLDSDLISLYLQYDAQAPANVTFFQVCLLNSFTCNTYEYYLRHLPGLLERFFIARQYLGCDSCVIVTAKYTKSPSNNERISKDELFAALARVVRENPILAARVRDERDATASTFERLPKLDFNAIVTFTEETLGDESGYRAFHERELVNPIALAGETPLWRLALSADNFIAFSWCHTIGDGQSGLSFHRLLLNALNSPEPSREVDNFHEGVLTFADNDTSELLPVLENLTDLKVSFKTLAANILNLVYPVSFLGRKTWSGYDVQKTVSPASIPKAYIGGMVFLSPLEAASLIELSRKHSTTLTAIITIAGVSTISKLLADQRRQKSSPESKSKPKPKKFTKVVACVPVSLRPFAGVSNTAIGNIVSTYNANIRFSTFSPHEKGGEDATGAFEFPWDAAASLTKKLRKNAPKTREYVGTLKYIFNNYDGYYKGRLGSKRLGGLEVSNLGAFKLAPMPEKADGNDAATAESVPNPWTIERTCFSQSDIVLGPALKLSTTGGADGSVAIIISWGDVAVDLDFGKAFAMRFQDLLGELMKTAS